MDAWTNVLKYMFIYSFVRSDCMIAVSTFDCQYIHTIIHMFVHSFEHTFD